MAHREVSIAVCGMVIGTMFGAGSILFGRDITASLSDTDAQFVSYRQGFILDEQSKKRSIAEADRRSRPQARMRTSDEVPRVIQIKEGEVVNVAECANKLRYAEEIRSFVIPLIPGRAIDQLVRSSMQDAFDEYIADCLPYASESVLEVEDVEVNIEVKPSTATDINTRHCYRYTGSRRSRCIVEEQANEIRNRVR